MIEGRCGSESSGSHPILRDPGMHVNNVKLLLAEKIDELGAEPIYYISSVGDQGVDVRLAGMREMEARMSSTSIISCHVWGARTRDNGERKAKFNVTSLSREHGIR
jgi:hypothetical protein